MFTPEHTTRREGLLETAMGVQYSYMPADATHVKIHGKLNDVPYIDKDVSNLKETFKHDTNHHDMQDTLAFFDQMQSEDKDFSEN
jgi:hypothetical protein